MKDAETTSAVIKQENESSQTPVARRPWSATERAGLWGVLFFVLSISTLALLPVVSPLGAAWVSFINHSIMPIGWLSLMVGVSVFILVYGISTCLHKPTIPVQQITEQPPRKQPELGSNAVLCGLGAGLFSLFVLTGLPGIIPITAPWMAAAVHAIPIPVGWFSVLVGVAVFLGAFVIEGSVYLYNKYREEQNNQALISQKRPIRGMQWKSEHACSPTSSEQQYRQIVTQGGADQREQLEALNKKIQAEYERAREVFEKGIGSDTPGYKQDEANGLWTPTDDMKEYYEIEKQIGELSVKWSCGLEQNQEALMGRIVKVRQLARKIGIERYSWCYCSPVQHKYPEVAGGSSVSAASLRCGVAETKPPSPSELHGESDPSSSQRQGIAGKLITLD